MSPRYYDVIASRNAALVGAAWAAVILVVAAVFSPKDYDLNAIMRAIVRLAAGD